MESKTETSGEATVAQQKPSHHQRNNGQKHHSGYQGKNPHNQQHRDRSHQDEIAALKQQIEALSKIVRGMDEKIETGLEDIVDQVSSELAKVQDTKDMIAEQACLAAMVHLEKVCKEELHNAEVQSKEIAEVEDDPIARLTKKRVAVGVTGLVALAGVILGTVAYKKNKRKKEALIKDFPF